MLPAMLLASCSEEGASPVGADLDEMLGKQEAVAQGRMSARAKRDNPYSVTNMRKAYASLYSTRADYQEGEAEEMVPVTDYYVRFLPKDKEDFTTLDEMGVVLVDTPLDSEPVGEGDQGQDQEIYLRNAASRMTRRRAATLEPMVRGVAVWTGRCLSAGHSSAPGIRICSSR